MAELTWDWRAAEIAQSYANECVYEHNLDAGAQYSALGGANSGLGMK